MDGSLRSESELRVRYGLKWKRPMDLDKVREMLVTWEGLDCRHFTSGTTYYGDPSRGIGTGWFHRLFAPLPKQDLERFAKENPYIRKFPFFKELHAFNGLCLFYDALFLFGIHSGKSQEAHDLPFNIVNENRDHWGQISGPTKMIIGGANFGYRSVRYVESEDGVVSAHERGQASTHSWPCFRDFFVSEVARLSKAFNANGDPIIDLETARYS